jgi:hypothetical protein
MRNISKMVESFKIRKFSNSVFGFNPHDATIGEWIKWWLTDSKRGEERKRRVINPAMLASFRRKRVFADILFAEETIAGAENYRILGVAEIENNKDKLMKKLENLLVYEEAATETREKKFPDLKFALLCAKMDYDYHENEEFSAKERHLLNRLIEKMQEISKKSRLYWILYLLVSCRVEEDATFRVKDYVKGYERFWYESSFLGSECFIYFEGKLRRHTKHFFDNL